MSEIELTIREREQARQLTIKAMRERLQDRRPDSAQYATETGRASRFIASTLMWAKAAVPVMALLAALASAVRTLQTASEIYTASGSHWIGVAIAAVAFTLATEGALFSLALAQEGEAMKRRAEKRPRRVTSLKTLWHMIAVRLGLREPLRHDQLHERDGMGAVLWIAFAFAISANAYMGLRPLLQQTGAASLQDFIVSLVNAPGHLQMTFIVDMAAVLFPPLMALQAGHLTARFAAEIAEQSQSGRLAYESDMERWRTAYADPLGTSEGVELLDEYLNNKLMVKRARSASRRPTTAVEEDTQPTTAV